MMGWMALREWLRTGVSGARYTATVRGWRFTSLFAALAIALSPVALDVCLAVCADPADAVVAADGHEHHAPTASATSAHAHTHHATDSDPVVAHRTVHTPAAATPVSADTMQAAPHVCAHAGELGSSLAPTLQVVLPPPAVESQLFPFIHTLDDAGHLAVADGYLVQPARIVRTTRLRV